MLRWITCVFVGLGLAGCGDGRWDGDADPYDLDFEIPRTEAFAPVLSDYGLYEQPMGSLVPTEDAQLYELSSELFTDYAFKQRLLMLPGGSTVALTADQELEFPEGSVLVKTFYYPLDMSDSASSARIIETRLLVKTDGIWNAATYLWNAEQTEATLLLDGTTTDVSWVDGDGASRSTNYAVPHEGECVTCHQSQGESTYIGPTATNLNRTVMRDGVAVNQLAYLRDQGVLADEDLASVPVVPNYKDTTDSLENRARAYLDINCAHCHNPDGWEQATERDFDFRYTTALDQTGLPFETDRVVEALEDGDMPYIGTTLLHDDGIQLVVDYLSSL